MAENIVKITLKGVDEASQSFKQTEDSAEKLSKALNKYAKLAGVAAVAATGALIVSSTKLAARVEMLGVVTAQLGKTAGISEEEIRRLERAIQNQGITTQSSRVALSRMIQANIDLAHSTDLARLAQDAAVIAGLNSSQAFETLINVITTGNVRMGRTIGLQLQFGKALEDTSIQLGKNVEELTEQEIIQSRTNEVLRQGVAIAGTYEAAMGTAGKQMLSLDRQIEEIRLALGEVFLPVLEKVVSAIYDAAKAVNEFIGTKKDLSRQEKEFVNDIIKVGGSYEDLIPLIEKAAKVQSLFAYSQQELITQPPWEAAETIADGYRMMSEAQFDVLQSLYRLSEGYGDHFALNRDMRQSIAATTKELEEQTGATRELTDEMIKLAETGIKELNYLIGVDFEDALQNHEQRMGELTERYRETDVELQELINRYGGIERIPSWKTDDLENLQEQLGKSIEAIDKEEKAWEENTKQILFNMASRALTALDVDVQSGALAALAESMGLIDAPTAKAWENIGILTQMLAEDKITVDDYGIAIDTLGVHLTDLPNQVEPEVVLTITGLDDLERAEQMLRALGLHIAYPFGPTPEERQRGGPVSPGVPYLVGEKEPEIFIPRQAGRIEQTNSNIWNMIMPRFPEGRQRGGSVLANMPYLVGEGGRPEVFVPSQAGQTNYDNSRIMTIAEGAVQVQVGVGTEEIETQMAFEDSLLRALEELG